MLVQRCGYWREFIFRPARPFSRDDSFVCSWGVDVYWKRSSFFPSFFSLFIFTPLIYSHSLTLTLTRQVGNSSIITAYSYYSRRLAFW